MTAEDRPCDACNALPGEPCAWDCIGLASEVDAIEARLAGRPADAVCDRCTCLICQTATPTRGSLILTRAMTVETSKLYAALHFRAEMDARHT